MNEDQTKKIFQLKIQLTAAIFILMVILLSGFFIFGPDLGKIAQALSANYSKTAGSQLSHTDWNNLPADFLARTGGALSAMQGALDMGNNRITNLGAPTADSDAATRGFVLGQRDVVNVLTGNIMKVRCGRTPPGATAWMLVNATEKRVKVVVDTSAAGFSSTPYYFVNLAGTDYNNRNIGGQSVRQPLANSFEVAPQYTGDLPFDENVANAWEWHIIWCAYGD